MVDTYTDATSGIDTCLGSYTSRRSSDLPATLSRNCTDNAGNVGHAFSNIRFDATAPTVSVKFSRPTDHNGWFNAPVDYMVDTNTDATSGIDTCQGSDTYSTPDSSSASVS